MSRNDPSARRVHDPSRSSTEKPDTTSPSRTTARYAGSWTRWRSGATRRASVADRRPVEPGRLDGPPELLGQGDPHRVGDADVERELELPRPRRGGTTVRTDVVGHISAPMGPRSITVPSANRSAVGPGRRQEARLERVGGHERPGPEVVTGEIARRRWTSGPALRPGRPSALSWRTASRSTDSQWSGNRPAVSGEKRSRSAAPMSPRLLGVGWTMWPTSSACSDSRNDSSPAPQRRSSSSARTVEGVLGGVDAVDALEPSTAIGPDPLIGGVELVEQRGRPTPGRRSGRRRDRRPPVEPESSNRWRSVGDR